MDFAEAQREDICLMEKNSIWAHELVKAEKEFSYHRFKIVTMGAPVIEANQKLLSDFLLGGGGDSMHCSDRFNEATAGSPYVCTSTCSDLFFLKNHVYG